jgi:hypothetical protein
MTHNAQGIPPFIFIPLFSGTMDIKVATHVIVKFEKVKHKVLLIV